MIRTLFIGTSSFAVPALQKLSERDDVEIVGVITQPDKPFGRKQELKKSDVKEKFEELNLKCEIFQPKKLKEEADTILEKTKPDLIVVASYGQFIPNIMLKYPRFQALNIHGSILPKLRGAVPIPMSILKGFKDTGITIQIMAEEMDAGDIIATSETEIAEDDNTETLTKKLSKLGAEKLDDILEDWSEGRITPQKQDSSQATFCYKADIDKKNAEIDWSDSAVSIDRKIKAFYPWPIAWTILRNPKEKNKEIGLEASEKFTGKKFMILKSQVLDAETPINKGGKLYKSGNSLLARCSQGWIEINEAQLEGKNKMPGKDYLFLANDTTVSVRGFLEYDDRILIFDRKVETYEYLSLPGGGVIVGESQEQALIREFKEETNLDIELGEFLYEEKEYNDIVTHRIYRVNAQRIGKVEVLGEEADYDQNKNSYKLVWLTPDEILQKNISENFRSYLKKNY